MPRSFLLQDLYTTAPILWGGPSAVVWFDGAPGVIEVDEPPTYVGEPICAAYALATNPERCDDAERVVDALHSHLSRVALAALRGDARADQIASRIVIGWNVVLAGDGDWPSLRVLTDRIEGTVREWQCEIDRLRRERALDLLREAIQPLAAELAWRGTGPYVLVRWAEDRPPLPLPLPWFGGIERGVDRLIEDAAYRLAVAEEIAARRGCTIPLRGDPCRYVAAVCTLSPEDRELIQWACGLSSTAVAPPVGREIVDRALAIMGAVARSWRRA